MTLNCLSSGCPNKMPQTGGLDVYFSQLWRLGSPDVVLGEGLLPGLQVAASLCAHRVERESELWSLFPFL